MMPTPRTSPASPSRHRRALNFAALLGFSVLLALVAGEIFLRLVPLPGIGFDSFYYDPVTGGKHYPGSRLWYRGEDDVLVRHRVNGWGFVDVDHERQAAPGTLRVGFFGDSYTEAIQVPLESAFFRLVETGLNARTGGLANLVNRRGEPVKRVETIAFGIPGRSTLQSYLECTQWMRPLDLDLVVYVFVENDPADQIRILKQADTLPYPVLAADSFVVDDSFHVRYRYKTSWWHRAHQRLKANSLVVSTIEDRLKLLRRYGIKRTVTAADRQGGAGAGGTPMAPSAWPPGLVEGGWALVERVLDRWQAQVAEAGGGFVVMRVPREAFVLAPLSDQDTWAPRLHAYCEPRGIPLVDPTPYFVTRLRAGEVLYGDHLTAAGHRAFAEAFVEFALAADSAAARSAAADSTAQ